MVPTGTALPYVHSDGRSGDLHRTPSHGGRIGCFPVCQAIANSANEFGYSVTEISVDALPAPPQKTGYTFVGWFTAVNGKGTEFTASTVVTASDTVFAKWEIKDIDGNIYTAVNVPPMCAITSPSNGAEFTAPANISINAAAIDTDGTISKVEFFADGTGIGEDATTPFNYTWTNVTEGSYSLTAKATHNGGSVSSTSPAVSVTVNPQP